ncbi:unnamed protein product [Coregonus sp. 'balchen']|nr:unnamed protein product [Coregonus sp. 'balchen']
MSYPVAVLAVLAACLCGVPLPVACSDHLNYRPIIGVLAQENIVGDPHAQGSSYIAASYVKYLESAGARVVPIRINRTDEEYEKIFNSINGLLLPGGDVDLQTSQFSRLSKIFYDLAIKANDASDYFPIWGTCQGFQQMTVLTSNKNLLTLTETKAVALPLTFTPGQRQHCNYSRNSKLKRFYKVLTTNTDGRRQFISTMEANRYPFYAVQWHPEKSPFEWVDKPGMVHSAASIRASFYTAHFFVSEGELF